MTITIKDMKEMAMRLDGLSNHDWLEENQISSEVMMMLLDLAQDVFLKHFIETNNVAKAATCLTWDAFLLGWICAENFSMNVIRPNEVKTDKD